MDLACVRLDYRMCSGWLAAEQSHLRQGCVVAPLLFSIFLAAVINVAYTPFKADKDTTDALVHLRKKTGAGGAGGGRGYAAAGEAALATSLLGMLYADDAGVVSQSPEQLRKMMRVNMVVCAAFSLTVLEAKTEIIMCLRTTGMPESTAIFSVEAWPGLETNERNIPRGECQPQCRPVHGGQPAHTHRMVLLPEVQPPTKRPIEHSPRAQNSDAQSRGTML